MTTINATAETIMGSFWEHYEAGDLHSSTSVLKDLGYQTDVLDFALDPDSYYFPNHRGSTLVRPNGVSDDKIPIVALEQHRTYTFEKPSLHYLQRIALETSGYSKPDIEQLAVDFQQGDDILVPRWRGHGSGDVRHMLLPIGSSGELAEAAPVLIFNIDPSIKEPANTHTSVAMHELTHIVQSLANPIWETSERHALHLELEAYGVQAPLVHSYKIPYTSATQAAGTVDEYRKQYLGEAASDPTPFFIQQFKQHEILGRILHD